jgi:DNA-binding beta-propeller fold protein YncE
MPTISRPFAGSELRILSTSRAQLGDFSKPTSVAVDADGNVYVTDMLNYRVEVFDADGKFIRQFGKHGDGPGYFAMPKGIAVDSDGHIWVTDSMQNRVHLFTQEGDLLMWMGNKQGVLPGTFSGLQYIMIDKQESRVSPLRLILGACRSSAM